MDNAKAFARDRLRKDGTLATYYYHGDWWQWNGRFYEIAPADRIAGMVSDYLDRALVRTSNGEERFRPKPQDAEALIKFLKGCVFGRLRVSTRPRSRCGGVVGRRGEPVTRVSCAKRPPLSSSNPADARAW